MNLIILGIMALCGASLNKIAVVAIILGVFDVIGDVMKDVNERLNEYLEAHKQKEDQKGDE